MAISKLIFGLALAGAPLLAGPAASQTLHRPAHAPDLMEQARGNPILAPREINRQQAQIDGWFRGKPAATARLQRALNRIHLWHGPDILVDGRYGPQTAAAVRAIIPEIYRVNLSILSGPQALVWLEARAEHADLQ